MTSIPEKSIAVLPFLDLSQAKDQEYFCDGISEEILDALAKTEGLRVVARTPSFSFKGKTADVGEIAQKLGVRNAYLAIDRIDDAATEAQRTVQLDPSYLYLEASLAIAYREKGDSAGAIGLYEKAQEATQVPSSVLAITYARMGRQDDARRILRQLIDRTRVQYVAAESIAAVYVALGENDEAFRWLERAFSEHSGNLDVFAFHREFRPLRSDPRFANLLRRLGVDPAEALARQRNP